MTKVKKTVAIKFTIGSPERVVTMAYMLLACNNNRRILTKKNIDAEIRKRLFDNGMSAFNHDPSIGGAVWNPAIEIAWEMIRGQAGLNKSSP